MRRRLTTGCSGRIGWRVYHAVPDESYVPQAETLP
jgi:hypothetical protein